MLSSSVSMKLVVDAACRAIPISAQTSLTIALRSATAHSVVVNDANVDAVKEMVAERILHQAQVLKKMANSTAPFKGRGMEVFRVQILNEIDKQTVLELKRVGTELSMVVAANSKLPQPSGGTQVIVNAPVGVLQTGPGSFGVATFTVDSAASEALGRAFDAIQSQLSSLADADVPFDRQEILELANEAKAETIKAKPNSAKLKSFVTGLGSAVSFAPKLKEAYDTLKWAANMAGIPLP